jgi:WD40 repeat protein
VERVRLAPRRGWGAVRLTSIRHSGNVLDAVFTPGGRHFATARNDGAARVGETATGRPAGPQLRHRNYVATVAFSPDGKTLAADDYGPDGLIKLWDSRTGKEVLPPLHRHPLTTNASGASSSRAEQIKLSRHR